jgi:hypothetical protein
VDLLEQPFHQAYPVLQTFPEVGVARAAMLGVGVPQVSLKGFGKMPEFLVGQCNVVSHDWTSLLIASPFILGAAAIIGEGAWAAADMLVRGVAPGRMSDGRRGG